MFHFKPSFSFRVSNSSPNSLDSIHCRLIDPKIRRRVQSYLLLVLLPLLLLSACKPKPSTEDLSGSEWEFTLRYWRKYNSDFGCEALQSFSCNDEDATGFWYMEITGHFTVGEIEDGSADLEFHDLSGSAGFIDYPQLIRTGPRETCASYSHHAVINEFDFRGWYSEIFPPIVIEPSLYSWLDLTNGKPGPYLNINMMSYVNGSGGAKYQVPCVIIATYDDETIRTDYTDIRDKALVYWPFRTVVAVNNQYMTLVESETGDTGGEEFSLRCISGCGNINCSQPCDDGLDCTTNKCEQGVGCIYENVSGNSCDDGNLCTEDGICNNGVCEPGPRIDCNDEEMCTDDLCISYVGCINSPNNLEPPETSEHDCETEICMNGELTGLPADEDPLQESPNDCSREVCQGGEIAHVPDDSEEPPQESPNDCSREVCHDGEIAHVPDDSEEPPQESPNDCYQEICVDGEIASIPDSTEPGCQ